jgi:probable rRNA maturation factor
MPVMIEMSVSEALEAEEGDIPDATLIQQWADKACLGDDQVVASVQIVNSDEMRELNRTWRGKDKPTNVLSFPMELPDEVDLKMLGDVVLCADVINAEAKQQHKPLPAHWAHMVVHGMLHLQGYDHIEDRQADAMEALEIRILNQLGFDNPYIEDLARQAAEQAQQ